MGYWPRLFFPGAVMAMDSREVWAGLGEWRELVLPRYRALGGGRGGWGKAAGRRMAEAITRTEDELELGRSRGDRAPLRDLRRKLEDWAA